MISSLKQIITDYNKWRFLFIAKNAMNIKILIFLFQTANEGIIIKLIFL